VSLTKESFSAAAPQLFHQVEVSVDA
jgi:hypothetical protein